MDAKELMIGDWVHVEAHRGFNAQNVKVETIPDNDADYEYGHHYGHIATWLEGDDFRDVEAKHLQPIPLTPEIVIKNGINRHVSDNYALSVIFLQGKVIVSANANEVSISLGWRNVIYVHELQHLIKLCGIDIEIKI